MIKARVFASILVLGLFASVLALVPALAADNNDSVGVADQTTGIWYLQSPNGQTTRFYYGNPGDYPIMGDWDCDGIDTPGLYRQSDGFVYLRNSNTEGNANIRFFFGNPGDIPLAGDFNADGCDTVSIYRPSQQRIFVINELGANNGGLGAADFDFYFGNPGDKPFNGDFNNNGQDTVGLHRESTGFVYYRNTLTTGNADNDFFWGNPDDQIITGRWAQNPNPGPDTVGLFRPSQGMFYLRFSNSQGNANFDFQYGKSDMSAVAGDFGSLPADVYQGTCSACHGTDLKGIDGLGKPLAPSVFVVENTEEELAAFIAVGRPTSDPENTQGVDMPPKGGNPSLDAQDLLNVSAYLKAQN